MTDIAITAANVLAQPGSSVVDSYAGAAVAAGKAVIRDVATGRMVLADSNAGDINGVDGIALNSAADRQPLKVLVAGPIVIGATLVPGTAYYLSETPGGIQPQADLASGESVVLVGFAKTTTVLEVSIQRPNVTL